ncbi:MAG: flagellar basal body rod protein FlgC [Alphaproteobacteria bacterium]|nr:flagellar basal body rod protein FlgC [Alphaproteobacteria bacterium]
MDLLDTIHVSASGLKTQQERLKVVAQNIANAESTGTRPGEQPYRRKTVSFKNALDKETGVEVVKVDKVGVDRSDFARRFEPNNPLADAGGYVLYPNVNPMNEMMDMREARRGYEANINVIEASKAMIGQTISLLR